MASIIPAAVRASGCAPTTGPVVHRMLASLATGVGVLACTLASAAPAQAKTTVTVEAPTSVVAHHGYWVQASGGSDAAWSRTRTCLYRASAARHPQWHSLGCSAESQPGLDSGMRLRVFAGAHGTQVLYRAVLMDARTHRITDTSTYGGQPPVRVRVR